MTGPETFPPIAPLPDGIRSRRIDGVDGLSMHVLEAGHDSPGGGASRPLALLLHGFPELSYSWRKVMLPLAEAGYHVIAPDQRGYGRTTGWQDGYDALLEPFFMPNLVLDAVTLVHRLGRPHADLLVGHDFGSFVAAWAALIRPDIFRSVALMSAPFSGPPPVLPPAPGVDIHRDLAALPRPRKHYQWYYGTRDANADMLDAPQGLHAFLRAYYHVKSGDWAENDPHPLPGWTAEALAVMPDYYIMGRDQTMADAVAPFMPSYEAVQSCAWLTEAELDFYTAEFTRTGFQGGLQWYRCMTGPGFIDRLRLFGGRTIDVPAIYIAGDRDWGIYQNPGTFEAMQDQHCTDFRGTHLIPGAGHWVQQEAPSAVIQALVQFSTS